MCTFFKQKNAGDQFIFLARFNLLSHLLGKSLVPPQIILSSYAHYQTRSQKSAMEGCCRDLWPKKSLPQKLN